MKIFLALFVTVICAVSGLLNGSAQKETMDQSAVNKSVSFELDGACYYAVTPILEYGREPNEIGLLPGMECEDIGPEDFIVLDEEELILDSVNRRVMIYKNDALSRSIDMDYSGYPRLFTMYYNNLYVFDSALDSVFVLDYNTGSLLEKLPIPSGINSGCVWEMSSDEESVYLWTDTYDLHDILKGGVKKPIDIRTENDSIIWSTPFCEKESTVEGVTACFLTYDAEGNSYFLMYEEVPNTPVILDEVTIRCFSQDGELLGIARIPEEDCLYHPCSNTYVMANGDTYVMLCKEQGVAVYEIQLGETYNSHMDELIQRADAIEKRDEL